MERGNQAIQLRQDLERLEATIANLVCMLSTANPLSSEAREAVAAALSASMDFKVTVEAYLHRDTTGDSIGLH